MQPVQEIRRPSWHEKRPLRRRSSGGQRIDPGRLQQPDHIAESRCSPIRVSPGRDRHSRASRRPATRLGGSAAREGRSPQSDGRGVYRRDGRQRSVPAVTAARHLPADWSQPSGDDQRSPGALHRSARTPSDQEQDSAQHSGGLLHLLGHTGVSGRSRRFNSSDDAPLSRRLALEQVGQLSYPEPSEAVLRREASVRA